MFAISKKNNLKGDVLVPGSKSHTIRAVLLAAMAQGTSRVKNPLPSNDCKAALKAAEAFGAKTKIEGSDWIIEGVNGNLKAPENFIDADNSGTTAFFVAPMATLTDGITFLTGDAQIRRRPILPLIEQLNALGATANLTRPDSKAAPVVIQGPLKGGVANFNGFNSQYISGITLVSPYAKSDVEIKVEEPKEKPYLQMTLDWMEKYGVKVDVSSDFKSFKIKSGEGYKACESMVPSDWSGVAFPAVAAVITDSEIVITGIDYNDAQGDKAIIDHLIAMGADITKDIEGNRAIIKGGKKLKSGLTFDMTDIPDMLPALSIAASFAEGDTKFVGCAHVRVKETDRVAVMHEELKKVGGSSEIGDDYMIVHGGQTLHGAEVDSHDDHRIAMAFTVCGLATEGEMKIKDAHCAAVSFPNFFEVMNAVGANFTLVEQ